jgi:hypothetical protein
MPDAPLFPPLFSGEPLVIFCSYTNRALAYVFASALVFIGFGRDYNERGLKLFIKAIFFSPPLSKKERTVNFFFGLF